MFFSSYLCSYFSSSPNLISSLKLTISLTFKVELILNYDVKYASYLEAGFSAHCDGPCCYNAFAVLVTVPACYDEPDELMAADCSILPDLEHLVPVLYRIWRSQLHGLFSLHRLCLHISVSFNSTTPTTTLYSHHWCCWQPHLTFTFTLTFLDLFSLFSCRARQL